MFKAVFSFKGRIRRLEYGLSIVVLYAYTVIMGLLLGFIHTSFKNWLLLALTIPAYWFIFAQGAKRCHDLGRSGWFQLIPFYGIVLLVIKGEYGFNRFGPNPKGEGNKEDVSEHLVEE